MKLLKQPNRWSCTVTCASMLTDVSISELCEVIGHDGSQKINDMPEPVCRRGFQYEEIALALLHKGWACLLIPKNTQYMTHDSSPVYLLDLQKQQHNAMMFFDGIICIKTRTGKYHAMAYKHDTNEVYDPTEPLIRQLRSDDNIIEFWPICNIKSK